MIYTSDLEEYLRLRQLFQLSNEQLNYHPGTSDTQPAFAIGQLPVHSTEWSLHDPSMSPAPVSLDPNWTMHTTVGHPTVDNLYQSNMPSSSTKQHRVIEDGIEDHLSPGQTTIHIQSSAPSPSAQETSPPNENNTEVADIQASSLQRQE
ncbi:hypothetical protein N7530_006951 [Penicillium desertorum]|uniref:Uncharacterized protein n=1 Tax=Penicillium desertorum TaxID=1303715 RepID=A0A9W9WSQ4_9EURO|nr:hypothetical protein N7530_006951 [Penicillium desertorum]